MNAPSFFKYQIYVLFGPGQKAPASLNAKPVGVSLEDCWRINGWVDGDGHHVYLFANMTAEQF